MKEIENNIVSNALWYKCYSYVYFIKTTTSTDLGFTVYIADM